MERGSTRQDRPATCGARDSVRVVSAIHARVHNGRLVLDEPTSLPEGAEVRLWVVEGDHLDDVDRAALHAAIGEGRDDANAGRTIDAAEWAAELRTRS